MKRSFWLLLFGFAVVLAEGCSQPGGPTTNAVRLPEDKGTAQPIVPVSGLKSPTGSNSTQVGSNVSPSEPEQGSDLLRERSGFKTKVKSNPDYQADGPIDQPPAKLFSVVHYPSAVGDLVAYLSPDPKDGKKHPALVYAHGGFGGINGLQFGKEQFAPFREEGYIIFCPSWRGENENAGKYEMFYGEVDDALAGIDFVRIAEGMGCDAARVDKAADLAPALSRALAHQGVSLVDVTVDSAVPMLYARQGRV